MTAGGGLRACEGGDQAGSALEGKLGSHGGRAMVLSHAQEMGPALYVASLSPRARASS